MAERKLSHEIDMWGYYCETYCRACDVERRTCEKCGLNYGVGQWHGEEACNKVIQAEKAKQLSFRF